MPAAVACLVAHTTFAAPGDDVLRGAMWETATYADQKAKLPAEAQREIEAYRRYVAERDPLHPGDDPILKATGIWRGRSKDPAFVDYAARVAAAGQAALAKGYRSEPLDDADRAALRDYAIYVGIQNTGARILPFHVGASRSEPFKPGEPAPDFCLPRLEDVLARPSYSDARENDVLFYLKPDAADRLFLLLRKPPPPPADGVRLSSLRGQPVVLILADPVDSFFPRCLAILEPIYRAYRDRAQFLIVHVTIHDTRMGAPEFFGPAAADKVTHLHPQTLEQRARTAKLLYMRYPNVTAPMVLDDMRQTTRNACMAEGGDARTLLVDVDGRLAHDGGAWFAWEKGPYRDDVLWANELETELVKLLANGGKADPERKALRGRSKVPWISTRPAFKDRAVSSYGSGFLNTCWLVGRVTAVGPGTVSVVSIPERGLGERFIEEAGDRARLDEATEQRLAQVRAWTAGKTYTFALDDKVELFRNGRECEPPDFRPGDIAGVKYAPDFESEVLIRPEQLRASGP